VGRGSGELFPDTVREIWARLRAGWPSMSTAHRKVYLRWSCNPWVRYEFEKALEIELPRTPREFDAWIQRVVAKVGC
jgi:hypothetical protein